MPLSKHFRFCLWWESFSTRVIFLRVRHVKNRPLWHFFYTWDTFFYGQGSFLYDEKWPLVRFSTGVVICRYTGNTIYSGVSFRLFLFSLHQALWSFGEIRAYKVSYILDTFSILASFTRETGFNKTFLLFYNTLLQHITICYAIFFKINYHRIVNVSEIWWLNIWRYNRPICYHFQEFL